MFMLTDDFILQRKFVRISLLYQARKLQVEADALLLYGAPLLTACFPRKISV